MFQTVIFDFDMTLVNSIHAITKGLNKMAAHFGLAQVDESDTRRVMCSEEQDFWKNIWGYHDEAWKDYFLAEVAGQEKNYLNVEPKTEELLQELKRTGKNIGLATNRHDAWGALSSVGLAKYFDAAVGCCEVAKGKPAPDMLHLIMSKLKANPAETLFIGDAIVDMAAATKAGIRGIGLLSGGTSKDDLLKAGAWQVRHDLKDLRNIFNSQP